MRYLCGVIVALFVWLMAGCSATEEKSQMMPEKEKAKAMMDVAVDSLYEVHKDGRIYVFYDKSLYSDFIKTGHTAYMFTRIGAGPNGESMVFALTGEDKKKRSGIPSVEMVDGLKSPKVFYGETYDEGRLYVFSDYQMMENYRKMREATYRYTDIGAGPNGESVVYVLSKSESKSKPEELIALFKKMN